VPTDPRRQVPPGATGAKENRATRSTSGPASGVGVYLNALRRFWWVVALGAAVATVAAVAARYSIGVFPPSLTDKTAISYTATSRLLVSSANNPEIRSQTSFPVRDRTVSGERASSSQPPIVQFNDINTVVRNANLYPLLIESDEVADFRRERYGELPGSVTALGEYATAVGNRVELSEIPVIRLTAVSDSDDGAIELADKTAKAFIGWLSSEQDRTGVRTQDRMVVEQLNVPLAAAASQGSSNAMPILVFLMVFGAFCVLAVLLDRLVEPHPERARERVGSAIEQALVKIKKTA
jgi:hypothetical protein